MKKPNKNKIRIYEFIRKYYSENNGLTPTIREISASLKLSTTAIYNHILNLCIENKLEYTPKKARSIVITDLREVKLYVCRIKGCKSIGSFAGLECFYHPGGKLRPKIFREAYPDND